MSLEATHQNVVQQLDGAMKALSERDQKLQEAEQKMAELAAELTSTAEMLRLERLGTTKLKDGIATLSAKNESLVAALEQEKNNSAAEKETLIAELEAARAGFEEAKDAAYNDGVKETEDFYFADYDRAKRDLFSQGWGSALTAAGVPEGNELYANVSFPEDFGSAPANPPEPDDVQEVPPPPAEQDDGPAHDSPGNP